jgi:arginyl-tRNA synthetase
MVRIKSILAKLGREFLMDSSPFVDFAYESERELALSLVRFSHVIKETVKKDLPSMLCQYIYEVSNKFNAFYHDKKILAESDEKVLRSNVGLISLTLNVLDKCINLLGFSAPEKM